MEVVSDLRTEHWRFERREFVLKIIEPEAALQEILRCLQTFEQILPGLDHLCFG